MPIVDSTPTFKRKLSVEEATALVRAQMSTSVDVEHVPLSAARHRILASTLIASNNLPLHDNAAVDGFAFCSQGLDAAKGLELALVGEAKAGHPSAARWSRERPSAFSPGRRCRQGLIVSCRRS